MAIAFHTIKRQPYGSCQLPITVLQNMIISYNNLYNHVLTISHHNMPCKNKLDVLYFVVASFTWLLRASSKNCSYLRIKTTTMFHQVWCFNLQQGPVVVKFDSTKVGEQTPARHLYAKQVLRTVKPVSCKRTRNVGPGRFISQYRWSKIWHAGKQYDLYRPQLTCVLLVQITSTHKN